MEQNLIESLRKQATTEGAEIDREAVLKLLDTYESVIRAEAFWGERGPKMAEELNALRTLESQARAIVTHAGQIAGVAANLDEALQNLDVVRLNNQ